MKNSPLLCILSGVILAVFFIGCDTNVAPEDLRKTYQLYGGLNKNLDNDFIDVTIEMWKDDSIFTEAEIYLGSRPAVFIIPDSLYELTFDAADSLPAGGYTLRFVDSPTLDDSLDFTVPGDLSLTAISLPENRINNGGDPVQIQWSVSLESDYYVFGAVLRDSIYSGTGYAEITSANSATIPRDAFALSGNVNAPDTGWYYVYVYAYTGSPANIYNLPFAMPGGLTENISRIKISGAFGAIVVSPRDSIHVVVR